MDVNAFEAVSELKKFFSDDEKPVKLTKLFTTGGKVSISVENQNGLLNIKAMHPLRIYARDIYNILLRLYLVRSTSLTINFQDGGKHKSVSKTVGPEEDIDEIIDDLLGLPHESIIDVVVDTEYFTLRETQDISDNINVVLKKESPKMLFKSLINYLFPFVNMSVTESAKEDISFSRNGDEVTVELDMNVDRTSLGIKSKKVRLV